MKAIVQEGYRSPDVLRLREIGLPAVADDGVLVRVHAASVNAFDAHLVYAPPVARPFFGLRSPRVAVRGVDRVVPHALELRRAVTSNVIALIAARRSRPSLIRKYVL